MKRTLSLQFLLMMLPFALFGQTDSKNDSESLRAHLISKETERKEAVLEYAKNNRIPLTGTGTNGEFMYLHHIANDRPVYYTTRDNNSTTIESPSLYIKTGENEWMPLENNMRIEKMNSAFLFIKSDVLINSVFVMNNDGKFHHKSKNIDAKGLIISTKNMYPSEYVISIKTAAGLTAYSIIIY